MNKKYIKYIEYIVSDIQKPYFHNMRDNYGLKDNEYNTNGNKIYSENSYGYWSKYEYDSNGNNIYYETSDGYWFKREYDKNGKEIYHEDSDGVIEDNR